MIAEFDQNDILKNTLFSIYISSTNPQVINDISDIDGISSGVLVNAFVVDDFCYIIIDELLVSMMSLNPINDATNKHILVDLEDHNGNIVGRNYKSYELNIYQGNDEVPMTRDCIAIPNIKQIYGVDILYGKSNSEIQ